jgi:ABC-type Fe3+ transport system permease subunit
LLLLLLQLFTIYAAILLQVSGAADAQYREQRQAQNSAPRQRHAPLSLFCDCFFTAACCCFATAFLLLLAAFLLLKAQVEAAAVKQQ